LRAALAMVVATGLLLGLSVARAGWPTHLAFRPLLEQMGYGRSTRAEFGQHLYRDPENQSFNSLFHHLFAGRGNGTDGTDRTNGTNGTDGTAGTAGGNERNAIEEGGTVPWANLGAAWANGLTYAAFLACFALVVWRTRPRRADAPPRHGGATPDEEDLSLSYGLFVLLGLLAPSIYWDHYAVIALWPLLAVYVRLPERTRGGAFGVAAGAWLALSAFREMGGWGTSVSLAVALGSAIWLAAARHGEARRGEALAAIAWAVAAALLGARYAFGVPGLRHGVGLLGMSIGLWGTLILFGLCQAKGGEVKSEV
jgi:hypothetical protein